MTDVYQVIYEHTAGQTVSFKTQNLRIKPVRHFLTVEFRPDGEIKVVDPTVVQDIITCSALISGDEMKILYDWYRAAITYSGLYPRLTTINLDGDTTLTNIEVAIMDMDFLDRGNGKWTVNLRFEEKTK